MPPIEKARRATPGSYKPGMSGNPGGRKRGIERQLRELLADDLPLIAQAQARIARGLPPVEAPDMEIKASDANAAARWCYDRVYGAAKQVVEIEDSSQPQDAAPTIREVFDALDEDGILALELAMRQVDRARRDDEDDVPGIQ